MTRTTIEGTKTPFLPERVNAFLRRRAVETGGLALAAAGAAALVALATYSAGDPSLNKAVDGPVRNALGETGAIVADLGLQSIGLAAALPGLILISWGLRVMSARPVAAVWARIAVLPVAVVARAAGFAGTAPPAGWTLRAGLGGYLGQFTLGHAQSLALELGLAPPILVLSLPLLGLGIVLALWLAAFSPGEWGTLLARMWRAVAALGRLTARSWSGGQRVGRSINDGMRRRFGGRRPRIEPRMPLADLGPFATPAPRPAEADDATDAPGGVSREAPPIEPRADAAKAARRARERQAALNLVREGDYELPGLDLLEPAPDNATPETQSREALEANAKLLMGVLEDFGVRGEIIKVRPGPVVTLYELEPAPGIKSSRVIGLADDIARSMSAISVRIAVVPGRNVIGIELPNGRRETVYLRELLGSDAYERTASKLTLVLGKDIGGAAVMADLARMPHLLIAGTTGSGKSVAINTMILSLLYRLTPDECRFIMIDPKMLELSVYDGIPHLLAPVVTEPGKAVIALRWTVKEMENRYRAMSELGVRNIQSYNQRLAEARRKGHTLTRRVQTGFDPDTGRPIIEEQELDLKPLPFIVVVVDEMADLMLVAGKEIEGAVQRLSQMARAAGIHIIMATQRPSVDVITGTIKANFPTRISFQVTSKIDSRTILGEPGAEQLLGQGDMLHMAGGGRITRVHGPFVSDREVERVVAALTAQGEPEYLDAVTEDESFGFDSPGGESGDALYDQAVSLVLRERRASTSFIQRHLQIGYNRAARIMDQMEAEGVVSPANHAGKREVLPGGSA